MSQHEENAKQFIQQGRAIVGANAEQAQAYAALAGAEAALALVEQQKIINEIALFSEVNFERALNPTDMTPMEWSEHLLKKIRGVSDGDPDSSGV